MHDTGIHRAVIAALRDHGYISPISVAAQREDTHVLKKAGTELIFHPCFDAPEYAADKLQHILR